MKTFTYTFVAGVLCILGALNATPAHAQTYNAHLVPTWLLQDFNCTGSGYNAVCDLTGTDGLTYIAPSTGRDFASAAAVQADGKLIVGGTFDNGAYEGCQVRRYLPDGTLDASFDGDGITDYNMAYTDCEVYAIALQSDGSIYVGGNAYNTLDKTYFGFVFRLLNDGSLATAFRPGDPAHLWKLGDQVQQILVDGANVIVIGSGSNGSDDDFLAVGLKPNGDVTDILAVPNFNLGGDNNDRASDGVLESYQTVSAVVGPGGTPAFTVHQIRELYVVGTADEANDSAGRKQAACAVAAFQSVDGATFAPDTNFDSDGKLDFISPVRLTSVGSVSTETLCYSALALPHPNDALSGIVVGGERYYNHAGTTAAFDASEYLLATFDSNGQNLVGHAYYPDQGKYTTPAASTYNSIRAITRQYQGDYLAVGLAGTTLSAHASADMGTALMNASFGLDPGWGVGGFDLLALDDEFSSCNGWCNPSTTFQAAHEGANALALDPWHGKVYVIGERDNSALGNGDDWLIGVVQASDRIFASNFAATSPND